ncbi:hypothetical protein ACP70R_026495 [Stipagrostis hirtigluma subsp. patula]
MEAPDGETEMMELEREVSDLGRRILEHRRSTAARLLVACRSLLAGLRPPTCLAESEPADGTPCAEADEEELLNLLQALRSKTKANHAAMGGVLKRVNSCIARTDELEQIDLNAHPAFRTKREQ